MLKITVFNLDAVIRYSEADMLAVLETVVRQELNKNLDLNAFPKIYSLEAKLQEGLREEAEAFPSEEKLNAIRKAFHKGLKKQFINDEDALEVRPGVQSIFSKLEAEKKWKYGITSPFWHENTKFILESCGVFSKTKLTLSTDQALTELEQIDIISERGQKKDQEPEIEIVCIGKAGKFKKQGYRVLKPKSSNKEPNYYVYPRFQEFFSLKRKKKKNKNKAQP